MLLHAVATVSYNQSTEQVVGGWLKIIRNIAVLDATACDSYGITGVCSGTGASWVDALSPPPSVSTVVKIVATNVAGADANGVLLSENLAYVPDGAKIDFSPNPSSFEGREAIWNVGTMKSGASKEITYVVFARLSSNKLDTHRQISAYASPMMASLFAPSVSKTGSKITVLLRSASGQPLSGATVRVDGPNGDIRALRTDKGGSAEFSPSQSGFYTYSAEGFDLAKIVSTDVQQDTSKEDGGKIAAAAISGSNGPLSSLMSILPTFAAIFGIAVVVLILYNFFTAGKEEEESFEYGEAQAEKKESDDGSTIYSQKYSFPASGQGGTGGAAAEKDDTKELVESRKRELQEELEKESFETAKEFDDADSKPITQDVKDGGSKEKSSEEEALISSGEGEYSVDTGEQADSIDEVAGQISGLGEKPEDGEMTKEEDEIERTISELEAIRQKLRERREKVQELERHMSEISSLDPEDVDEAIRQMQQDGGAEALAAAERIGQAGAEETVARKAPRKASAANRRKAIAKGGKGKKPTVQPRRSAAKGGVKKKKR